jgi:hypothetical protein
LDFRKIEFITHNNKFNVAILKDRSLTVWGDGSNPADLVLERPVANVHFTQTFIVLTTVVGDVYTFEEDGGITLVKTSLRTDINNRLTERLYRMNIDEVLSQCQQEDSLYNAFYTFSDTAVWYNYFSERHKNPIDQTQNGFMDNAYSFLRLKITKMKKLMDNSLCKTVEMICDHLLMAEEDGDSNEVFKNSALYKFVTWLESRGQLYNEELDKWGSYWFVTHMVQYKCFHYPILKEFVELLPPDGKNRFRNAIINIRTNSEQAKKQPGNEGQQRRLLHEESKTILKFLDHPTTNERELFSLNIDEVLSRCKVEQKLRETCSDEDFWYRYFKSNCRNFYEQNDFNKLIPNEYSLLRMKVIMLKIKRSIGDSEPEGVLTVEEAQKVFKIVWEQLLHAENEQEEQTEGASFINGALFKFVTWLESKGQLHNEELDKWGTYWFVTEVFLQKWFGVYPVLMEFLNLLPPDVKMWFWIDIEKIQTNTDIIIKNLEDEGQNPHFGSRSIIIKHRQIQNELMRLQYDTNMEEFDYLYPPKTN